MNSDKRYTRWPELGALVLSHRLPIRPSLHSTTAFRPSSNDIDDRSTDLIAQDADGAAIVKRQSLALEHTNGQSNSQAPISSFLNVFQGGKLSLCVRRNGKVAALRAASRAQFSEIQTLIRSSHKNVIQIFAYIQNEDVNYIQHEYLEVALNEIIGCPITFSETQIGYICREVLSGLEYLDSIGLEHTKVESSRVLLSQPNIVKIGDALSIRRKTLVSNIATISFPAVGVGAVALDMMENGILSENEGRAAALTHPENWSVSASDFVRNTSCSEIALLLKHAFVNPGRNPNLTEGIVMGITCVQRMWTSPDQ
ncbi:hypothetical protein EYR41_004250 [Orbilia oligospora]|uniref:Uncharacterized protein n=1 Tax=Orbilia oligospora TaxID=2813651 RepID=A0A7C8P8K9_ORBOL|nr:hypothetical protein TWF751_000502 [Orbilia oligospora]TGJ72351.1 hypothetical protein EYR41_004250 [Orbilia oligospora]